MTVLLDVENLSPTPSAEENLIILRYYPQSGEIDTNTPTPHGVCISASGVRVADKGYQDDVFFKGFRRGWVENDVYWRVVGNSPNCYISGGTMDNKCKFIIHKDHDMGYDNTRIMVKLPHEGIVYCRGVGVDFKNPKMTCVLFNRYGRVRDQYGYLGKLGHWKDIFQ